MFRVLQEGKKKKVVKYIPVRIVLRIETALARTGGFLIMCKYIRSLASLRFSRD